MSAALRHPRHSCWLRVRHARRVGGRLPQKKLRELNDAFPTRGLGLLRGTGERRLLQERSRVDREPRLAFNHRTRWRSARRSPPVVLGRDVVAGRLQIVYRAAKDAVPPSAAERPSPEVDLRACGPAGTRLHVTVHGPVVRFQEINVG